MKRFLYPFIVLALATMLVACGTTSGIKGEGGKTIDINLSKYENVVVLDFADGTEKSNLPEFAGRNFADRIAAAVRGKAIFKEVVRDSLDDKSIVISGEITRYAEGNAALKLLIGFGAGSTYFDAKVKIADSESNKQLGEIIVDKNSWVLGGGVASSQTVDYFMIEASEKIAEEIEKAKNYTP
jgi:predicted small secreted protein